MTNYFPGDPDYAIDREDDFADASQQPTPQQKSCRAQHPVPGDAGSPEKESQHE